jgi:hypothetical protein
MAGFVKNYAEGTHEEVSNILSMEARIISAESSISGGSMGDEWIKRLPDHRRVKFTNQALDEWAFITAQTEGNKVVYSIVLTDLKNALSREEVENHFENELSKVSPKPKLSPLWASRQRPKR